MIVLWIILVILACILLLLCFPVGIHLSYWTPKDGQKQTVPYKTEAVDKEIDELELCEGDKEVLRQAVEELGCYEKEPEKQLTATVQYLFFQIKLYPMKLKQKPEKEEKKKEPSPQKANQKESKKEETSFDIKAMLPAVWECAKKPLTMILNGVCVKTLKLSVLLSKEDTAQSALDAQKLVTAVYTGLGVAQNLIQVKKADIQIKPDFSGQEQSDWQGEILVQMRPIIVLGAALRFVVCFAIKVLGKAKKEEKSSTSPTKECGKSTAN